MIGNIIRKKNWNLTLKKSLQESRCIFLIYFWPRKQIKSRGIFDSTFSKMSMGVLHSLRFHAKMESKEIVYIDHFCVKFVKEFLMSLVPRCQKYWLGHGHRLLRQNDEACVSSVVDCKKQILIFIFINRRFFRILTKLNFSHWPNDL